MSDNVYWIFAASVNEGELDNLRALMEEMVAATEANEPGALAYEWWLSEDQSSCHIYERYADAEAVMVHMGNFGKKYLSRFMSAVTPSQLFVYGADDNLKKALAAMGGQYYSWFGGFKR